MLKEKELTALNTILTQERKVLLDKEEEIKILRGDLEYENKSKVDLDTNTTIFNICLYFIGHN